MSAEEMIKDRELMARVATYNPHLAGTLLRLCNDLQDAARQGDLPPVPLLAEFGVYVEGLGKLITTLAHEPQPESVVIDG